MSEIEKLYKLAGLEYCQKCRHDSEIDCIYLCENKHPEFTAEKQIRILNLLGNIKRKMRGQFVFLKLVCDTKGWIAMLGNDIEGNAVRSKYKKTLYKCLAELICYAWQYLTTDEQNKIRDILK